MPDLLALLALTVAVAAGLHAMSRLLPARRRPWPRRWRCVAAGVVALPCAMLVVWQISASRSLQLAGAMVTRVQTAAPKVALSFDDGPSARGGREILDVLAALDVRATFFFSGHELALQPDLARRFVAAGHELGNHGWSHQRMLFRSRDWIAGEIGRTDALIRSAGQAGPIPFRPPYFRRLLALPWYLRAQQRAVVLADVEPESWPAVGGDSAAIVAHVLEHARAGSIVLLHVMYPSRRASLQAVPGIVRGLRARGFELVTVSELLAAQPE